ncbi:MAG: HAMP domain-containing histidine kinase [Planctomycetes bacterium]|nr:HAMP domain-containing histidine kinase [Planctomycetota bacterium]
MGHIENGLSQDWTERYLNKVMPDHQVQDEHLPLLKERSPLERLEERMNHLIEGLAEEKEQMKKKNDAWLEQVRVEMIKGDQLQSLGRLVASLAHEINNPNSFIKINAPLLMELWQQYLSPNPENPIARSFIEERIPLLVSAIEEGAQRIDVLVKDLKDFARQNHDEKFQSVDLRSVIQSALRMNKKYIEKHTQKFNLIIPESLPTFQGIAHRLEQVVVNLLHNACDALEDASKAITLEIQCNKESVTLTMSDEGCGMDEATRQKIFEPFFTTKPSEFGMGMGMTVIKNILDQHKAQIEVVSKPNAGSSFIITFSLK